MSCTKASTRPRKGSQILVMHVVSAITGDACAATVAGVSGASNGSGATYMDHNTSRLLRNYMIP